LLGGSKSTEKQHLTAISMIVDWTVTGDVLPFNHAAKDMIAPSMA